MEPLDYHITGKDRGAHRDGARVVADVRGGSVGTHITERLRPGHSNGVIEAITIAGGSLYSLESTSGVA
jgi:L-aminopeptidase/D-esterase-like protein